MPSLVSIIVPVYNTELYIQKCLSSLVDQTYRNIEIILVNDGSSDRSQSICEEIAQADSRVKLISQKNAGVSSARNHGFKYATGEYILFVDADDWCEPDMVEYMVEHMEQSEADIFMIGHYINDTLASNALENDICHDLEVADAIMLCLSMTQNSFGTALWNKIFRKDIIDQMEGFDQLLSIGEDMDYLVRYLKKSRKIIYSRIAKYHYIRRNDSAVATVSMGSLSVIKAHKKVLSELNEFNSEIKASINERMVDNAYTLLWKSIECNVCRKQLIKPLQECIRINSNKIYIHKLHGKKRYLFNLVTHSVIVCKLLSYITRIKRYWFN